MKTNLVTIQNGKAVTSSLQIAKAFNREHKTALQSIKDLDCSIQFKEQNFLLSFYISELHNGGQRKHPMYYLTKDGFTFLVMGFTGKKAGKFKEDYINSFNKMEEYIKNGTINEQQINKYLINRIRSIQDDLNVINIEIAKQFGLSEEHRPADIRYGNVSNKLSLSDNINNILTDFKNNIVSTLYISYRQRIQETKLTELKTKVRESMGSLFAEVV